MLVGLSGTSSIPDQLVEVLVGLSGASSIPDQLVEVLVGLSGCSQKEPRLNNLARKVWID